MRYNIDQVDKSKPYKIHYHLKKKVFSISGYILEKKSYRLVYHGNNFKSEGYVYFKVSEKRRLNVIKKKNRDVHAFIICENIIFNVNDNINNYKSVLSYNPYKYPYFYDTTSQKMVQNVQQLYFNQNKVFFR